MQFRLTNGAWLTGHRGHGRVRGPIWRCAGDRVKFFEPAGKRASPDRKIRSGRPAKPRSSSATTCRVLFRGLPAFGSSSSVAKHGFDETKSAGKVERVPRRVGPRNAVRFDGVRLFFENSTGCLISQCQLWQYPGSSLRRWVGDSFGNILLPGRFSKDFVGEFDPGSGRTLAACLTHASRAERPFGVLERRTGE